MAAYETLPSVPWYEKETFFSFLSILDAFHEAGCG